jgi:hypothetical protein
MDSPSKTRAGRSTVTAGGEGACAVEVDVRATAAHRISSVRMSRIIVKHGWRAALQG